MTAPHQPPPFQPPPKKGLSTGAITAIIVGALILVCGGGCGSVLLLGTAATTTTQVAQATTTTSEAPTTTETTPPTTGQTESLAVWSAAALPDIEALQAVMEGFDATEPAALRQQCRDLQNAVADVQAHLPAPHAELDAKFSAALENFALAGATCVAGIEELDTAKLELAVSYINEGTSQLLDAVAVMNSI